MLNMLILPMSEKHGDYDSINCNFAVQHHMEPTQGIPGFVQRTNVNGNWHRNRSKGVFASDVGLAEAFVERIRSVTAAQTRR